MPPIPFGASTPPPIASAPAMPPSLPGAGPAPASTLGGGPAPGSVQLTLSPDDVTQLKNFVGFLTNIIEQVAPSDAPATDDDGSDNGDNNTPASAGSALNGLGAEIDAMRGGGR